VFPCPNLKSDENDIVPCADGGCLTNMLTDCALPLKLLTDKCVSTPPTSSNVNVFDVLKNC